MKNVIKPICAVFCGISFFGVLFFACALDSVSDLPFMAVMICIGATILFGIPAGAFRQED